jgi:hypothetical protein
MNPDASRCSVCTAPRVSTELTIRNESRRHKTDAAESPGDFLQPSYIWIDGAIRETYVLCQQCTGWVTNLMGLATDSEGQPDMVLGLPIAAPAVQLGDGHCDYCKAELDNDAMGLDLNSLAGSGRERGAARQQRLCRQCAVWWISLLDDPASLRGRQGRAGEGLIGNWQPGACSDVASIFVARRDEYVISATVEENGNVLQPITLRQAPLVPAGTPIFVTAGKKTRATKLVASTEPDQRRFIVVIARIDCQEDTSGALLAGAGDFLVSPLSPQQVTGALDRINAGIVARPHEPTGLPILPLELEPRGDAPSHLLAINAHEGLLTTALLARRFLRGYDRVGVDATGSLIAHVACPSEAAPKVAARLAHLLGCSVRVKGSSDMSRSAAA